MALREILAKFGFEIDSKQLSAASQGIGFLSKSISSLSGIAGGVAGALGLGVVKDQIDDLAKESEELRKAATKSAVGFQQFQRIQYQTGLGADQLSTLFRKLQQNVAGARGEADKAESDFTDAGDGLNKALGKKQAEETFKALGVQINDARGEARASADVFQDTALALAKVKDPAQRTALAIRLFGRSGADLLPFLEKSPEAIAQLADEFDAIGGFSDEARDRFKDYAKANKLLKLETKALKIAFVSELAPALTYIIKTIGNVGTWFKKNVDTSNLLKVTLGILAAGFLLLGNTAVGSAIKATLAWARAALPIVVLTLLLDDLIHFFSGDANTATEKFLETLFGAEEAANIVESLRGAMGQFVSELNSATSWADKLWIIFKGILGAVERIGAIIAAKILGVDYQTVMNSLNGTKGEATKQETPGEFVVRNSSDQAVLDLGKINAAIEAMNAQLTSSIKVPLSGDKKEAGNRTIQQTNQINIKVEATGEGADVGEAVGDGVRGALNDERRAAVKYLEAQKG